jgi:radical SAM superfamily enzyme YgiQ (UPF0313 family)
MASSKRLLLINPWIYDFTAYDFWMKPLGLLQVAGLLRASAPYDISFIDCLDRTHPGLEKKARVKPDGRGPLPKEAVEKPSVLKNVPRRFSRYGIPARLFEDALSAVPLPDAVLLTGTMTYWYPGIQTAVDLVRRRFGTVPVILGGIYATLCPGHARFQSGADIIAPGPAERSLFPALREALGDGVPGPPEPPDFAGMPEPAFDLLRDRTWLPLLTSRGCPFRCTFCAGPILCERFEQRPPAGVAREIAGLHRRFGTRHFPFYDDALLIDKDRHIVPILEDVSRSRLPLRFHTPNGLHVREIDEPLARLFRRSGMASLYLSLESVDEALLSARSPKTGPDDLRRALRALTDAGYPVGDVHVYLIMGLPGQGTASVKEGIRYVRRLGAVPRLAFFSPIPGTLEWRKLVENGTLADDADPLLHNKLAFAYLKADFPPDEFHAVTDLLNEIRSGDT